jgi:hypothetical protein
MYMLCGLLSRLMLTRTDVDRVGKTFVVATVLGCLMGLLYYYGGIEYRDLLPSLSHRFMQSVDAARGDRLRSVYPHAILMGGAIAMNLPFLILWLARTDSGRTKAWLWIALGVELLCMYRTMSRGPWMATGIMLPILFVFCRGAARRILVSLGALAALVLLLRPGVFQTLYDLFYYTFVPQSLVGSSFSYRSALLNLAFSTLGESLTRSLFGFGPGTFFDLQLVAEFKDRSYRFFSCDSSWIAFMFGSGYVGFATMAILLLRPLWDVFRLVLATEGEDRQNAAAILACLAGFYFMMTNVAIFDWAQPQYMPWILIAMFTALRRLSAAAPAPVESAGQDGDAEARD